MASRSLRGSRAAAAQRLDRGWLIALRETRAARALIAHEHRTAAGLFALVVLVYLWPALVEGHPLAPLALLRFETPWALRATNSMRQYLNGDLADVPISYYPWDALARSFIHAGTFPSWNPYAFAGTPLFANVQVAWASPFSLPLWLLPLNYGLGVAAALKLWTAAFGTYLLVRELRLGFWPGIVAGIGFALCAFNVAWLTHGVFVSVAALLPWTLWLTERLLRRGRSSDGLALTAVVAAALAGGHPGTQAHILAATALYALVRAVSSTPLPRRDRAIRLGWIGAALALGGLLTAWLLLPGGLAAHDTIGTLARGHGSPGFASSELNVGVLRTALFPEWWGRPSEHLSLGPSYFRERTFYAGAPVFALALVALLAPGGWRRKGPFVALAALGTAVALRTPGLWDLVIHLPVFDRIQNGRSLLLFVFSVPVLAAFGVQALLDRAVPPRRLLVVLAICALAPAIAIASLSLDADALGAALRQMLHRSRATVDPTVLALASVGWWIVLVGAAALTVALVARRRRARWPLGAVLAALVALDLLHFAHGFQPMGPTAQVVPPRTPAIAFLQRHVGDARIAGIARSIEDWVLPADWSSTYGLRDVRGFDAPFPTLRYYHLLSLIDAQSGAGFAIRRLGSSGPTVLGMLGVRYVITPPGLPLANGELRVVYDAPDARVYQNLAVLPRTFVASGVAVVGNEEEAAGMIASEAFDPRVEGVVERGELASAGLELTGGGNVRVISEHNDEVRLRARLRSPGLVVLIDQIAAGWSVKVDGRPARPVRTDMVLRGVVVPAGTHEIVWSYRVPGLRAGAALSGVGLVLVLAWAGLLLATRRARRSRGL
jgi:hypothetical protein